MECSKCPYYASGHMWNTCKVIGAEYFTEIRDCKFVNDDGTVNEEAMEKAGI